MPMTHTSTAYRTTASKASEPVDEPLESYTGPRRTPSELLTLRATCVGVTTRGPPTASHPHLSRERVTVTPCEARPPTTPEGVL